MAFCLAAKTPYGLQRYGLQRYMKEAIKMVIIIRFIYTVLAADSHAVAA